ncbi:MATE family efflux transporter [Candidatus Poribacteria bacterium]|nr:MATE family efflux transporter [Candidatus Poribacteria bacterium]
MNQQKSDENKTKLLQAPVGKTLISLSIPMGFGIMAILLFAIVDTLYIGRLGAEPLAAMGFIFPINFIVMNLTRGLGIGVTSTIARAIGEGNQPKVQRLATDGLGLAVLIVTFLSLIGLTQLNTIFSLMGAEGEMLALISDYMIPWCLGVGFLIIPMIGVGILRATGDTKTPAIIMTIAGLINIVLDPLLIFGIGPFPRLELQGAALATVASWVVAFIASLWILGKREGLIRLPVFDPKHTFGSWKQILYIGIPAAGTNVMEPVSMAMIIRIISEYGEKPVAAFGVGGLVGATLLIGIRALSLAAGPFVGQNFGAGNYDRIRSALRFGSKFSLVWGGIAFALFYLLSGIIAPIFNDDETVIAVVILFLHTVPMSYGMYGISALVNAMFNALGKPLQASLVIILHLFVFVLPLAYLGSRVYGLKGTFIGIAVGNAVIGIVAYLMMQKFLVRLEADRESTITDAIEPAQ